MARYLNGHLPVGSVIVLDVLDARSSDQGITTGSRKFVDVMWKTADGRDGRWVLAKPGSVFKPNGPVCAQHPEILLRSQLHCLQNRAVWAKVELWLVPRVGRHLVFRRQLSRLARRYSPVP